MLSSNFITVIASFAIFTSARPSPEKRNGFPGVATFNNYTMQGHTVCGPLNATANSGYFGAASGDISKDISPGRCDGAQGPDYDMSVCDGEGGITNSKSYIGPSCTKTKINQCDKPTCFRVQNVGSFPATGAPEGSPITVQIIDSCPASHAQNYCKAQGMHPVVPQQRCGDGSTNYLDIDRSAYPTLTGDGPWESSKPNLSIMITPVDC